MVNHNSPLTDETHLVVRRGRVDSVDLYEVKENELELLENGAPATLQLNFAIFLYSIALTAIIALATTNFKWAIVETIFTFISVIGILMGSYLMISWWRTRTSIAEIIRKIKNRITEDAEMPSTPPQEIRNVPDNDEAPSG